MPTPRTTAKKTAAPVKKAPAKRATKAVPPRPSTPGPQVSGIAAKRAQMRGEDAAQVDPYAPTVWGAEDGLGTLTDIELPSGQVCLAQRPGPQGLMVAGLLDDLDMLATVLPKVMGGKTASKKFDAAAVMKNPKMMQEAIRLMDRVVVHVVIKPEITPEPENPSDKVQGNIYPSSVSMEDKMFLFNWAVGGTRDLTRFRGELKESMASVDSGADVEDSPV